MPIGGHTEPIADSDLIALSALQHHLFCPRQCALIHVEQAWAENALTAEGRILHERTSEPGHEVRRGVRVATAMPLVSRRLGVSGIADLVELYPVEGGGWRPVPVEYKRGKPKSHRADEVQLCAQAIALEEMFATAVPDGVLFYGATRRRTEIRFDETLRRLTSDVAAAARAMIAAGLTPPPVYDRTRCRACSLADICRPKAFERSRPVAAWLNAQIDD